MTVRPSHATSVEIAPESNYSTSFFAVLKLYGGAAVSASMSLALVQDYSSEEEAIEEEALVSDDDDGFRGEKDEREPPPTDTNGRDNGIYSSQVTETAPATAASSSSLLPSPEALFSEVTGPPEFLKSSATEPLYTRDTGEPGTHFTPAYPSDPLTDSGPGVAPDTEAKSFGSHKQPQADSEDGTNDGGKGGRPVKGVVRESISAAPRLYTTAQVKDPTAEAEKRNRSKIKDKEKNKRMKGQSSHATWKSETEMQLRQQFD